MSNIYKNNMEKAKANLLEFLKTNDFEIVEKPYYPLCKDGYILETYTNLYNEYELKYILVTPENVILYGIKTPYNFNKWTELKEIVYTTKEELVSAIKSLIFSNNIEGLWND